MKYLKNVVTLQHDPAVCTNCGMCLNVCPHRVFERRNGQVIVDDRDACMECGACARNCPAGVISVQQGVGCAAAVIIAFFEGGEPTCG